MVRLLRWSWLRVRLVIAVIRETAVAAGKEYGIYVHLVYLCSEKLLLFISNYLSMSSRYLSYKEKRSRVLLCSCSGIPQAQVRRSIFLSLQKKIIRPIFIHDWIIIYLFYILLEYSDPSVTRAAILRCNNNHIYRSRYSDLNCLIITVARITVPRQLNIWSFRRAIYHHIIENSPQLTIN